jgi:SAM-dependent methyltransferase
MLEESVEQLVVRHLGGDGRVLDFGCGFGSLLGRLKKLGYEAVGIDANATAVESVRAMGCEARQAFDLEDGRFPSASFDALLVIDSFCFVLQPHRFLSEAARILKPGGLLIMRISNYRLAIALAARLQWSGVGRRLLRRGLRDQYHVIGLPSLRGLLSRQGFRQIRSSPRAWTTPLREAEWVTRASYAGALLLWAATAGKFNIAPGVLLRCIKVGSTLGDST